MNMSGKRVLVTGSGTGIGRGIALAFAHKGAIVSLHYSHSSTGAESVVKEILAEGGKAEAFQADFNRIDETQRLAREAVDYMGGIDVLVNNAGITHNVPFDKVTPEVFETLYHVNIRAQFFITQTCAREMARQGQGIVINLTSIHAYAGLVEHALYAGTKGAIVAYTRALALELIQQGIRVNAIAPGWIRVENQEKALGADFNWTEAGEALPAGFIGDPRDIANFALFLASDESRYMIGQTLLVDGGLLSVMPLTGDFRENLGVTFGKDYVPGV